MSRINTFSPPSWDGEWVWVCGRALDESRRRRTKKKKTQQQPPPSPQVCRWLSVESSTQNGLFRLFDRILRLPRIQCLCMCVKGCGGRGEVVCSCEVVENKNDILRLFNGFDETTAFKSETRLSWCVYGSPKTPSYSLRRLHSFFFMIRFDFKYAQHWTHALFFF